MHFPRPTSNTYRAPASNRFLPADAALLLLSTGNYSIHPYNGLLCPHGRWKMLQQTYSCLNCTCSPAGVFSPRIYDIWPETEPRDVLAVDPPKHCRQGSMCCNIPPKVLCNFVALQAGFRYCLRTYCHTALLYIPGGTSRQKDIYSPLAAHCAII